MSDEIVVDSTASDAVVDNTPTKPRLAGVHVNDFAGNSFLLGGMIYNALVQAGFQDLANEAQKRIGLASSFDDVVKIASEYVDF